MSDQLGLRERKKMQQRELIADAAAALFAERGFDAVSMAEVARAADVSDQTVYNYFPTKPDLVLDRADEYRTLYSRVVRDRPRAQSPADALQPILMNSIDFYLEEEPGLAGGEFPALCLQSDTLRRFALELRQEQGQHLAAALLETDPAIHPIVARAHAAALISVIQSITDATGRAVINASAPREAAAQMRDDAAAALAHLDQVYRTTLAA
ncbi:helix-turn-helix domain containing protein [Agreia sp. PsM10]|uniref:TetR/AcrR family transcriptional regulator n=1 Tax=Agreia sp. PsM10 TaxID=3030533 RepID=UPI00263AC5A0|nr:TetR/AcrR family transcriptional regulator [Agreia sp. PsM10]MDN4640796.1 helix-turn-helix domain containing protein [Agreia sp. PsM10]